MSAHRYRVVVEGELGPRYASAFDGMTLSAHDGRTEIIGAIVDPSHLHGLLDRITGLGLTVAEGIVHQHGGIISASNRSQGGACLELTLPAAETRRAGSASCQ